MTVKVVSTPKAGLHREGRLQGRVHARARQPLQDADQDEVPHRPTGGNVSFNLVPLKLFQNSAFLQHPKVFKWSLPQRLLLKRRSCKAWMDFDCPGMDTYDTASLLEAICLLHKII